VYLKSVSVAIPLKLSSYQVNLKKFEKNMSPKITKMGDDRQGNTKITKMGMIDRVTQK